MEQSEPERGAIADFPRKLKNPRIGLQQTGALDAFDTVFLELHGADLTGFFLLRAAPAKLDPLKLNHKRTLI